MNFDDFSYEEDGRRYLNPQIALDEENAFIQRLRDTQGQRNAQIAQQTHNLGKDVPTNYGGLNGSEAYFNARYQTPQTNSLIGDLRATAQATALSTALNNELTKANKRYKDAYYAAKDRERAATETNNLTNSKLKEELGITQDSAEPETITQNDTDRGGRGRLDFRRDLPRRSYIDNVSIYTTDNGDIYKIRDLSNAERLLSPLTNGMNLSINPDTKRKFENGDIFNYQGNKYLYLDNKETQGPAFYVVEGYEGRDDENKYWSWQE